MSEGQRTTYLLVDGENIDATLGTGILRHRPAPDERPRWDRVLEFAARSWGQPARGLFFLAANNELPASFVQALLALDYRPVPLSGAADVKVVDVAIQRTLEALVDRDADVLLVSHDADFVEQVTALVDGGGRRVGIVAFDEFRSQAYTPLFERGLHHFDLEYDVRAFRSTLPRVRIIPIEEFDPLQFL